MSMKKDDGGSMDVYCHQAEMTTNFGAKQADSAYTMGFPLWAPTSYFYYF